MAASPELSGWSASPQWPQRHLVPSGLRPPALDAHSEDTVGLPVSGSACPAKRTLTCRLHGRTRAGPGVSLALVCTRSQSSATAYQRGDRSLSWWRSRSSWDPTCAGSQPTTVTAQRHHTHPFLENHFNQLVGAGGRPRLSFRPHPATLLAQHRLAAVLRGPRPPTA